MGVTSHSRAQPLRHSTAVLPPQYAAISVATSATAAVTSDQDEALDIVAREITRGLDADCLLVTWHGGIGPLALFTDGAPDALTTQQMQFCAANAAGSGSASEGWLETESDAGDMLSAPISTSAGVVTITALFRRLRVSTRSHVREVAGQLLPLVRSFLRLWFLRSQAVFSLRHLTAALNSSDVGVVLVNGAAELTFTNTAADTLLAAADGVRRVGNTLSSTRLADTLRLQAAIEHVTSDTRVGARSNGFSPVIAIQRRTRRPLLAAVVACKDTPMNDDGRAAIVYLFDPEEDLRPLLEPVCKLYGLTPVETKLTCLLAAEGVSLADAAERMRVREQTARSYLKQVFQKTETNRQAELVCLMLKSSVRTSPDFRVGLI